MSPHRHDQLVHGALIAVLVMVALVVMVFGFSVVGGFVPQ